MCFFNVVKFVCGTIVVCLGVNVMGMEQERNSVAERPKLVDWAYDRYDNTDTGFGLWKSDLEKFQTSAFSARRRSSDAEERNQALDEVIALMYVTSITSLFLETWGSSQQNRDEALEILKKVKNVFAQQGENELKNNFDVAIASYYDDKDD